MDFTTEGKFPEALNQFRTCIQMIPLSYASTEEQEKALRELIKSCAEYITGMRCQIERMKQPPTVYIIIKCRIKSVSASWHAI